jgi:aarF domain-containing kinase
MQEFRDGIWEEVDFVREGRSLEMAGAMFRSNHRVKVPAVHWSHTTSRALTMEAVEGVRVDDHKGLKAKRYLNASEIIPFSSEFIVYQVHSPAS